ncbi:MAG: hypothetical protein A2Z72_08455 [Omnitrophica bacterium RBG_13_46_9]|nr:MAG: hypothetical protein A2Z72_08455 [Omnitrophica bacterium RBG_13_46_9]
MELAEEGKIKRIFRARGKISYPGAVCHITQRASGKEPLFLEDSDYLYMLHLIKDVVKKFKLDVFCYVLMPNHLHILMRLSTDNLSKSMKDLFERYATYFNKKYERKGHVFGSAFRQALCFSDNYLFAASLYIHLNPVRAHIVQSPTQYRWSSCKLYARAFNGTTFIAYKFILKMLDNDIARARGAYCELLGSSMGIETQEVWEEPKALEYFRIRILEFMPKIISAEHESKEEFIDERKLEEKITQLRTKGRLRSPETLKARKFLIEQLRARGYALDRIGKMLGVSRQAIHKIIS